MIRSSGSCSTGCGGKAGCDELVGLLFARQRVAGTFAGAAGARLFPQAPPSAAVGFIPRALVPGDQRPAGQLAVSEIQAEFVAAAASAGARLPGVGGHATLLATGERAGP